MKDDLIGKYGFKKVLEDAAKENGIDLTPLMLEQLEQYKELLIEWNEKSNLTAITDEYEIILKHFVDSLECIKYIEQGKSVIDVGTGAGFPGLVIAIYFKEKVKVTLLDALNKRLVFLEEVIDKLNLKNVNIVHGRAEEMAQNEMHREKYDVAVSRAVAGLNVLLEFDTPYIKIGGKCLLMKGDNAINEIEESHNASSILNCKITNKYEYNYIIEDETYNRFIIEVEKIKSTPKIYPRMYGKIKKAPLK